MSVEQIKNLKAEGKSYDEICSILHVSKSTVSKALKNPADQIAEKFSKVVQEPAAWVTKTPEVFTNENGTFETIKSKIIIGPHERVLIRKAIKSNKLSFELRVLMKEWVKW